MCNGMMLPSLPVSTLYVAITLFLFANVFKFAVITEQFSLKCIEFIFTKSMLLSSILSVLDCLLFHLIHDSGSPAPTHSSELAHFAAVCTLPSIGWALSLGMAVFIIIACLLCGHYMCMDGLLGLSLHVAFIILKLSNSCVSGCSFLQTGLFGLLLFRPAQYLLSCYLCIFLYFGELHKYLC